MQRKSNHNQLFQEPQSPPHYHRESDKTPEHIDISHVTLVIKTVTDADWISVKSVENARSHRATVPFCWTENNTPVTLLRP